MSMKRSMIYLSSKKCQIAARFIKRREWKRTPSYKERQINHKNPQTCYYGRKK